LSVFALEALGRYRKSAAEWHHIISWPEVHDMTAHTTWPKEMLEGIEAKLAAAAAYAGGGPMTASQATQKVLLEAVQAGESADAGRQHQVQGSRAGPDCGRNRIRSAPCLAGGPGPLLGEQHFPGDFGQAHGTGSASARSSRHAANPVRGKCVGAHHRESGPR
jgi:hypothetical protein